MNCGGLVMEFEKEIKVLSLMCRPWWICGGRWEEMCVWGHCQDLFQPGIQLKIQQRQQSFWTSWMVGL